MAAFRVPLPGKGAAIESWSSLFDCRRGADIERRLSPSGRHLSPHADHALLMISGTATFRAAIFTSLIAFDYTRRHYQMLHEMNILGAEGQLFGSTILWLCPDASLMAMTAATRRLRPAPR